MTIPDPLRRTQLVLLLRLLLLLLLLLRLLLLVLLLLLLLPLRLLLLLLVLSVLLVLLLLLLLLLVLFVILVLLVLLVLVVVACKCQLRNDHWAKNTQLCATSISGGASKNRPLVYCEPPKNNPQAAHQDLMLSLFPAKIVKWYFNVCVCVCMYIYIYVYIYMYIYIERERETCSYTHAWTHKIGLSWQETIQFYPIWGKNSHLSSSVPDAITVWPRVRALGMAGWPGHCCSLGISSEVPSSKTTPVAQVEDNRWWLSIQTISVNMSHACTWNQQWAICESNKELYSCILLNISQDLKFPTRKIVTFFFAWTHDLLL